MLPKEVNLVLPAKLKVFQNLFQKDSQADLFLSIAQYIFPVHRSKFRCSQYITYDVPKYEIVHIITEPLSPVMTSKVLSLFYESNLSINTMKELDELFDVLDYLRINQLINEVQKIIDISIKEYDIFPLLQIAYKYNLHQTFQLCMKYLEQQEFQQINYNRFEFIRCDFILFQIVLRRHHRMKISEMIEGLTPDAIEEVIRLYCTTNKYDSYTVNRLIEKYVKSLVTHGLLKLDKILKKQVLESAIMLDPQKNKNKQKQDRINENDISKRSNRERAKRRKYSCNVVDIKPWGMFKFGDSVQHQKVQASQKMVQMDQGQEMDSQKQEVEKSAAFYKYPSVNQSQRNPFNEDMNQINLTPFDIEREKQKINKIIQNSQSISQQHLQRQQLNEDTGKVMGKISVLLEQLDQKCNQSDEKMRKYKSSKQEYKYDEEKELQIPMSGKFTNGFKLTTTLQIPNLNTQNHHNKNKMLTSFSANKNWDVFDQQN